MQGYLFFCLLFLFSFCKNAETPLEQVPLDTNGSGDMIARKFCLQCHLFPDPEWLDKNTWKNRVLPNMGQRLGISTAGYDPYGNMDMMEQLVFLEKKVYPEKQIISENDWKKIVEYYIQFAPDSFEIKKETNFNLSLFEVIPLSQTIDKPRITMLHFDSMQHNVFVGLESGTLYSLDTKKWNTFDSIKLPTTPVAVAGKDKDLYLLTIGKMYPTEQSLGEVYNLTSYSNSKQPLIGKLHRPVFMQFFHEQGQNRLMISEFGYETGKLSQYSFDDKEFKQEPSFMEQAGAVKSFQLDINQDGISEIIVLVAQGDERVLQFEYDEVNKRHTSKILLRFSPLYGSCDLDIADMNMDGWADIIITHGDNADYSGINKPYHGIDIYKNNGKDSFSLSKSISYPGALLSEIADYDMDGDLDIAATSFFPGDEKYPSMPFRYFENIKSEFKSYSMNESQFGKWMTMVSGDFDQDGDLDLLIGSFLLNTQMLKGSSSDWRKHSLILLKNKTK